MKNLINRLGARAATNSRVTDAGLSEFEQQIGFSFPSELSALLSEFGGAVVFDQGAKFIPLSPSGREDDDGYLNLEILYGVADGPDSLNKRYMMTKDGLPAGVVPIGEASGGDQIRIEKDSLKILFWKHDVNFDQAMSEVADGIGNFLVSLKPDIEPATRSMRKIIRKDSFLDF